MMVDFIKVEWYRENNYIEVKKDFGGLLSNISPVRFAHMESIS